MNPPGPGRLRWKRTPPAQTGRAEQFLEPRYFSPGYAGYIRSLAALRSMLPRDFLNEDSGRARGRAVSLVRACKVPRIILQNRLSRQGASGGAFGRSRKVIWAA